MGLFGPAQIKVSLKKHAYIPGETIAGTVALKLKKPVFARKLIVSFIGEQIDRQTGMRRHYGPGRHGSRYTTEEHRYVIYNFEIPLDGETTYFNELYHFKIKIPHDIIKNPQSQPTGKLGTFMKVLHDLASAGSRVEWYVEAKLDVPLRLDIRGRQKIVLSRQ